MVFALKAHPEKGLGLHWDPETQCGCWVANKGFLLAYTHV